MPASSSSGRKLVTNVPSPRRISRTRAVTRARTASRIVLRPVPSDSASSASGGSRSPGDRLPEAISSRTCSIAASVNEAGIVGRLPPPASDRGLDMGCLSCVWYSVSSTRRRHRGIALGEVAMSTLANVGHPTGADVVASRATITVGGDSVDGDPTRTCAGAAATELLRGALTVIRLGPGPHPRRPRRRHDAPVTGVPHHRQRRQHPVADGGDRLAGDRPAARHHHQGHRSCRSARRWRSHRCSAPSPSATAAAPSWSSS